MPITLAKNFDAESVKFDSVKKNALGGKVVYLSYENEKKITIQTPELSAPFGLGTYTDENTGVVKYSVDLSFRGKDTNDKISMFMNKMMELDEYMIKTAVENSKEWFGKKMSKEVVAELYRPIIKPSKDPEKYAPTMKFKIRTKDDVMQVQAFDQNKEPFELTQLGSGAHIAAIAECNSVWFVNKQFGISWTLVQAKINQPESLRDCAFVDSDVEEDDVEEPDEEEPKEDPNDDL